MQKYLHLFFIDSRFLTDNITIIAPLDLTFHIFILNYMTQIFLASISNTIAHMSMQVWDVSFLLLLLFIFSDPHRDLLCARLVYLKVHPVP